MKEKIKDKSRKGILFVMTIIMLSSWVWAENLAGTFRTKFISWSNSQIKSHEADTREHITYLLNEQLREYEESVQNSQLKLQVEIREYSDFVLEETKEQLQQYKEEMKTHIDEAGKQSIAYYKMLINKEAENTEGTSDIIEENVVQ